MRVHHYLTYIILGILFYVNGAFGDSSATPSSTSVGTLSTVNGITTVHTDIYRATTLSSLCAHASQTGSLNGRNYRAAYDITGKNSGWIIVSRVLTVTWYFQFDQPIEASAFSVSKFGLEISNVKGSVNLEHGSFLVSYDVTLPYLTIIVSVPLYCAADYVTFEFSVPPASDSVTKRELPPGLDIYDLFKRDEQLRPENPNYDGYHDYGYSSLDGTSYDSYSLRKRDDATHYYAFYVGTAGAVIGTIISQTFCGLTNWFNCPVYTQGLSFDCDAFKSYLSCSDSLVLTESYTLVPTPTPSSSSTASFTLSSSITLTTSTSITSSTSKTVSTSATATSTSQSTSVSTSTSKPPASTTTSSTSKTTTTKTTTISTDVSTSKTPTVVTSVSTSKTSTSTTTSMTPVTTSSTLKTSTSMSSTTSSTSNSTSLSASKTSSSTTSEAHETTDSTKSSSTGTVNSSSSTSKTTSKPTSSISTSASTTKTISVASSSSLSTDPTVSSDLSFPGTPTSHTTSSLSKPQSSLNPTTSDTQNTTSIPSTTFTTSTSSSPSFHTSVFTTTWTDSAGHTSTGIVSEYPTTGSDGVAATGTTTIPIIASDSHSSSVSSSDFISSSSSVSYSSSGASSDFISSSSSVSYSSSGASSDLVSSSSTRSHTSVFTTTWTDSAGHTSTGIVSEYPTTGSDGVAATGTSTIPITASGSSASGSLSSSSGSSIPSSSGSLSAPYMTGFLQDGHPHWNIIVPGTLGPWSSVEVHSTDDSSHYDLSGLQMLVDGAVVSGPSNLTKNSYDASYEDIIERSSNLVFSVFAQAIAGKNYTNNVEVAINTIDDKKLVKRAVLKFLLSATITTDASSIGSSTSAPSSSETLSSLSASGVASDSASITGCGSFSSSSTVGEQSNTVITVTSCSDEKCSSVPITTGVTTVTSTVEGIVTTYTTYCPLTSIEAPSTTVVTITSCSSHVCSKVTATTGVTVVTETNEGTETIYTTYCPISSIAPSPENPSPSGIAPNASSSMESTAAHVSSTGGASNVPQGGKPESGVGSSPSKSGPNGNAQPGAAVSHGNVGASSNTAATAVNTGTAPVVSQGSHNSGVAIDSTSTQTVLATATVSNGQVSARTGPFSFEGAATRASIEGVRTLISSSTTLIPDISSTYEDYAVRKGVMASSAIGSFALCVLLFF